MDWLDSTEGLAWEDETKAFQVIREMPPRQTARTAKLTLSTTASITSLAKEGICSLCKVEQDQFLDV